MTAPWVTGLADQVQAAHDDQHRYVPRIATGGARRFQSLDDLPPRIRETVDSRVRAYLDGEGDVCGHAQTGEPMRLYAAGWTFVPAVVCDQCRSALMPVPDDLWCGECGGDAEITMAVVVGSLLTFMPVCAAHQVGG